MIKRYLIYNIFAIVMMVIGLTGCSDDKLNIPQMPDDETEMFSEGFSLTFTAYLDNMGGAESRAGNNPMEDIENYIDPEKFRVFFFDSNDKFLFESKSRWIKQTEDKVWSISVPFYTFGNDKEYNWDWDAIREKLTSGSFKIAIRANYPLQEWYPGFNNTGFENDNVAEWIDNQGPYWDKSNSIVSAASDDDVKDVFDFHHCQYDKLYHAKGESAGYYKFIMGGWNGTWNATNYNTMKPTMGATASWVNWGKDASHTHPYNGNQPRHFIIPSQEHPIPMYGIQRFEKINEDEWVKGTSFTLGRQSDKSIFLLRSVVKMELIIPKTLSGRTIQKPTFVSMIYSNIYSRCEPMNNWDPTDEIWNKEHANSNANCEIDAIMSYGSYSKYLGKVNQNPPDSTLYDAASNPNTADVYMQRISWFYGIWKEKGWDFPGFSGTVTAETANTPYPQIFNSCIQRNAIVFCDDETDLTDAYGDNNYHYVVYTGERNMLDPSKLGGMDSNDPGDPTVCYFNFAIGSNRYAVPITNYNDSNENPNLEAIPYNTGENVPNSHTSVNGNKSGSEKNNDQKVHDGYSQLVQKGVYHPWPLVRNHVYRLTLTGSRSRSVDDGADFTVRSEDLHSRYISRKGN